MISTVDKMKKDKLRWFEHVQRRCVNIPMKRRVDAPMRRCKRLIVGRMQRGMDRSKKILGRGD